MGRVRWNYRCTFVSYSSPDPSISRRHEAYRMKRFKKPLRLARLLVDLSTEPRGCLVHKMFECSVIHTVVFFSFGGLPLSSGSSPVFLSFVLWRCFSVPAAGGGSSFFFLCRPGGRLVALPPYRLFSSLQSIPLLMISLLATFRQ